MECVITAVAVLATALLVYYAAEKPYRPKVELCRRRAPEAVIYAIKKLSRECASVERGAGVSVGGVARAFLSVYNGLIKKSTDGRLTKAERATVCASGRIRTILVTAKKAFAESSCMPHVRGVPRIFLLCERFVEWTNGSYTDALFRRAVAEFEENSPLEECEKRALPYALAVCLVVLLSGVLKRENKLTNEYDKGVADGESGRTDLDVLSSPFYCCGLLSTDNADIMRLSELNGIDGESMKSEAKRLCARDYSIVASAIDRINELKLPNMRSLNNAEPNKSVVLPCIAAFFCGLWLVTLSLFIGTFVIPILVGASLIFASFAPMYVPRFIIAVKRLRKKRDNVPYACDEVSDVSYFGGEPDHAAFTLAACDTKVTADNRGRVELAFGGKSVVLGMESECDGEVNRLIEFDGASAPQRTVYRLVKKSVEYSAQIIAPVDGGTLAIKMSFINRTGEPVKVKHRVCCAPLGCDVDADSVVYVKNSGAAFTDSNDAVSVFCDGIAEYAVKNSECISKSPKSLVCENVCEVEAFSVATVVFVVSAVANIRTLANTFALMRETYFECESYAARAFAELGGDGKGFTHEININDGHFRGAKKYAYAFSDVMLDTDERFTDDGYEFTCTDSDRRSYTLADDVFCARLYANGYSEESYGGNRIVGEPDGIFAVTVALGENDGIWSPFGERVGFFKGYCEYSSGKNGAITTLKRFMARGRRAEVFYISVEDRSGTARNIDVMFAVAAGRARVVRKNGSVYAFNTGERRGFAIFSSDEITDSAEYRESFVRRGVIDRTSGFMNGGSTVMPAVSVKLSIPPSGKAETAFCIAVCDDGVGLYGITVKDALMYLECEKHYGLDTRIRLHSSDATLNAALAHLFDSARAAFCYDRSFGRIDSALIECFAVKYADITAVRDYIIELCKRQDACGKLESGKRTLNATLLLPLLVKNYVEFAADGLFFAQTLPFKTVGELEPRKATLLEHCLRAIDYAALNAVGAKIAGRPVRLAPLMYAAASAYLPYLPISARRKQYTKLLGELRFPAIKLKRKIAAAEIEYDALGGMSVLYRYAFSDDDGYDGIVKLLGLNDKASLVHAVGERVFSGDGVTAALACVAIVEKLLGVGMSGNLARILPRTTLGTPHIEFELTSGDYSTRIVVDDAEGSGSWQMNIDRVTYATDSVLLTSVQPEPIIFKRSGE